MEGLSSGCLPVMGRNGGVGPGGDFFGGLVQKGSQPSELLSEVSGRGEGAPIFL